MTPLAVVASETAPIQTTTRGPKAVPVAPKIYVETVTDYRAFLALRPVWNKLVEEAGMDHPFMTHDWTRVWWDSFGAGKTLHILLAKAGQEVLAIAPLMIHRQRVYGVNVRQIEFIANVHTQRADFIVASRREEAYGAIWRKLISQSAKWDILQLCRIPNGSPSLKVMAELAETGGCLTGLWQDGESPYLTMRGTWKDYLASLDSKFRSNLRNRFKRLDKLGEVKLEAITSREQLDSALEDGLKIEAAAWKGQNGTAIGNHAELRRFYTDLAGTAADLGWLRLHFLTVNGQRIAFGYSICFHHKLYLLKPGYLPEFSAYSPCNLMCARILEEAFAQGITEFDFLGVNDSWKLEWTQTTRPHTWLYVLSNTWRMRLLHYAKFRLIPQLKRLGWYEHLRDLLLAPWQKAPPPMPAAGPVPGAAPAATDHQVQPKPETRPPKVWTIRNLYTLDALGKRWNRLASQAYTPMQDFAWTRACAEAFFADGLSILAAGNSDDLQGVMPLVHRRFPVEHLEWLGLNELYEPTDVLAANPAALQRLAEACVQTNLPIYIQRVPERAPIIEALRQAYRGKGLVIRHPVAGYPWIPLDIGAVQPEARLNPRRRSDLSRARRFAERIGPVEFEVLSPKPAETSGLVGAAFLVEKAGWKGRTGTALVSDSLRGAFYHRYALAAARQGTLRLCFLRIGGRAAAMQLAMEYAGRFWLLKIGYDETFARCSPGTLLMVETLRHAAARGLYGYELLGVVEPWTLAWSPLLRNCVSVAAYPRNWRGAAAFVYNGTQFVGRRMSLMGHPGADHRCWRGTYEDFMADIDDLASQGLPELHHSIDHGSIT